MNSITRLAIFDFDGTLKDTHDNVHSSFLDDIRFSTVPEEIKRYSQRSIEWLSSRRSVEDPEGDDPWLEHNVEAALQAYNDSKTFSVLLTARNANAAGMIRDVLDQEGIRFNEYIFKREMIDPATGESRYLDAPEFKAREVTALIERFPNLEVVEVYEDSQENLDAIERIIPNDIVYVPNLESTRLSVRQQRKALHKKMSAARGKERADFYKRLQAQQGGSINEWRTLGDPALPGEFNKGGPKKRAAPHDNTYGNEPDLLDKPGVIVEPDVRKKISNYFKDMKLRETIRAYIKET